MTCPNRIDYIQSAAFSRYFISCRLFFQVCDALQGNVIGRRDIAKRQGQTVQVKCCDSPLCNRNLIDKTSIHGGHGSHGHTTSGKYRQKCPSSQYINRNFSGLSDRARKKPNFFPLVRKAGEIAIAHYMYVQRWFSGRQYQNWSMQNSTSDQLIKSM